MISNILPKDTFLTTHVQGRNICAGNSTSEQGDDPIHNYMDYSDDSCLNQFTRDQRTRMLSMYKNLRLGSVP